MGLSSAAWRSACVNVGNCENKCCARHVEYFTCALINNDINIPINMQSPIFLSDRCYAFAGEDSARAHRTSINGLLRITA